MKGIMRINFSQTVLRIAGVTLAFTFAILMIAPVQASSHEADVACSGITAATGADCDSGDDGVKAIIQTAIRILLFVVGAASVIMLIIGGIRYVMAAGDSTAAGAAKNTIIYAVIGLIVSLLAWAAVDFVLNTAEFTSAPPTIPKGAS